MEIIDNRFKIIKKIYTSEIADTYLTEDINNENKLVDVKILVLSKYIDKNLFNMFKIETLVIRELEFYGLPKYITHNEVDNNNEKYFYIAYKHIEGKTLKEILNNDSNELKDNFLDIISKLLDIFEYLESKKIIHKAISTENIVIDENLNIFLINFGAIRNKLNSGRSIEPIIGDMDFMPTEQKLGFTTSKSDQYALGFLLSNIFIKKAENHEKMRENLNKSEEFNQNIKEFIKILINKDSTERFITIKKAKEIFNKIKNNEDIIINSGHQERYENDLEEEYIAKQIVENERAYREIDEFSNKKKMGKGIRILLYLLFIGFWIYLLFYMLGSFVRVIEFEDKSYHNYHKQNNKLINIYKNNRVNNKKSKY